MPSLHNSPNTSNVAAVNETAPVLKPTKEELNLLLFKEKENSLSNLEKTLLTDFKNKYAPHVESTTKKIQGLFNLLADTTTIQNPQQVKVLFVELFGQITDEEKKKAFSRANVTLKQAPETVLKGCLENRYLTFKNIPPEKGLTDYEAALILLIDILSVGQMKFWEMVNGKRTTLKNFTINTETIDMFWEDFFKFFPNIRADEIQKLKEGTLRVVKTKAGDLYIANNVFKVETGLEKKERKYVEEITKFNKTNDVGESQQTFKSSIKSTVSSDNNQPNLEETPEYKKFNSKVISMAQEAMIAISASKRELVLQELRNPKTMKLLFQLADKPISVFMKALIAVYEKHLSKEESEQTALRMRVAYQKLKEELEREPNWKKIHEKYFPTNLTGKQLNKGGHISYVREDDILDAEGMTVFEKNKKFEQLHLNSLTPRAKTELEVKMQPFRTTPELAYNLVEYLEKAGLDIENINKAFLKAIVVSLKNFRTLEHGYRPFILEIAQIKKIPTEDRRVISDTVEAFVAAKGTPFSAEEVKKMGYDAVAQQLLQQRNPAESISQKSIKGAQQELLSKFLDENKRKADQVTFMDFFFTTFTGGLRNSLFQFRNCFDKCPDLQTLEDRIFTEYALIDSSQRRLFQNVMASALGQFITATIHNPFTVNGLYSAANQYSKALEATRNKNLEKNDSTIDILTTEDKELVSFASKVLEDAIKGEGDSNALHSLLFHKMSPEERAKYPGDTFAKQLLATLPSLENIKQITSKVSLNGSGNDIAQLLLNMAYLRRKHRNYSTAMILAELDKQMKPLNTSIEIVKLNDLESKRPETEKRVIKDLMSSEKHRKETLIELFGESIGKQLVLELPDKNGISLEEYISALPAALAAEKDGIKEVLKDIITEALRTRTSSAVLAYKEKKANTATDLTSLAARSTHSMTASQSTPTPTQPQSQTIAAKQAPTMTPAQQTVPVRQVTINRPTPSSVPQPNTPSAPKGPPAPPSSFGNYFKK